MSQAGGCGPGSGRIALVLAGGAARGAYEVGVVQYMRRLADSVQADADFLSYLLFDGEFAGRLIELGRADARARHAELCALFNDNELAPPP